MDQGRSGLGTLIGSVPDVGEAKPAGGGRATTFEQSSEVSDAVRTRLSGSRLFSRCRTVPTSHRLQGSRLR